MAIWSIEAKELEKLFNTVNDNLPILGKEIEPLTKTNDANVVLLYARRCLEVIVTELCETELKRPRKTEPLKGIIDKLGSEDKVPSNIITSMQGLNSLATFGTHPKDFDPEQVKPVLNNLTIVIKWYLKFKGIETLSTPLKEYNLISLEKTTFGKQNIAQLEKSVAILPFRNDSPDDENTYFINGVMEEILNNLQRIRDIRVISRTSVEQYRNQGKPIPEIAKELGVNYIVEGSGQKYGNSFRLRAQLIMADHESHLWGESFQQKITEVEDIFNIQTKIAESIAYELNAVISPKEKELIEKIPTNSIGAYEAYLKGRFYWSKLTQNDLETSTKYFENAIELDPEYAPAHAGIALVGVANVQMGYTSPEVAGPKIQESLMKALELDSSNAEVQYTLGVIAIWTMWDWASGEEALKKAIAINPNHAEAHAYYSHLLNILGRTEEAMAEIEIALRLDPFNPLIISLYSVDLWFVRRFDEATKAATEAIRLEPFSVAQTVLTHTFHKAGRYEEAWESIKKEFIMSGQGQAFELDFKKLGYTEALIKATETLEVISETTFVDPTGVAIVYLMAGNNEKALECLEKAYELRTQSMPYLRMPAFDPIRDDPRFREIARKMNIPYK
jgi:TolB-like protein/Tfp pilus assembly protein PilF